MQAMLLITAARYLGELDVGYLDVLHGMNLDQQACHQCRKRLLPHSTSRACSRGSPGSEPLRCFFFRLHSLHI